jgi:hypothetical protein
MTRNLPLIRNGSLISFQKQKREPTTENVHPTKTQHILQKKQKWSTHVPFNASWLWVFFLLKRLIGLMFDSLFFLFFETALTRFLVRIERLFLEQSHRCLFPAKPLVPLDFSHRFSPGFKEVFGRLF